MVQLTLLAGSAMDCVFIVLDRKSFSLCSVFILELYAEGSSNQVILFNDVVAQIPSRSEQETILIHRVVATSLFS